MPISHRLILPPTVYGQFTHYIWVGKGARAEQKSQNRFLFWLRTKLHLKILIIRLKMFNMVSRFKIRNSRWKVSCGRVFGWIIRRPQISLLRSFNRFLYKALSTRSCGDLCWQMEWQFSTGTTFILGNNFSSFLLWVEGFNPLVAFRIAVTVNACLIACKSACWMFCDITCTLYP